MPTTRRPGQLRPQPLQHPRIADDDLVRVVDQWHRRARRTRLPTPASSCALPRAFPACQSRARSAPSLFEPPQQAEPVRAAPAVGRGRPRAEEGSIATRFLARRNLAGRWSRPGPHHPRVGNQVPLNQRVRLGKLTHSLLGDSPDRRCRLDDRFEDGLASLLGQTLISHARGRYPRGKHARTIVTLPPRRDQDQRRLRVDIEPRRAATRCAPTHIPRGAAPPLPPPLPLIGGQDNCRGEPPRPSTTRTTRHAILKTTAVQFRFAATPPAIFGPPGHRDKSFDTGARGDHVDSVEPSVSTAERAIPAKAVQTATLRR